MVQIFFIYAENCEHCKDALSTIESAIIKCSKISCEIIKFRYDTKSAVSIAINKGINDLPGFVIGDDVYMGKNYTEEKIVKSIKKASK
jgi:hypothetical protein